MSCEDNVKIAMGLFLGMVGEALCVKEKILSSYSIINIIKILSVNEHYDIIMKICYMYVIWIGVIIEQQLCKMLAYVFNTIIFAEFLFRDSQNPTSCMHDILNQLV